MQAPPRKRQQVSYAPLSRPIDRHLPDGADEVDPVTAGLYARMQACERRAETVLSRKRFDLQDMLAGSGGSMNASGAARSTTSTALTVGRPQKRTLRIFLSNTAADQPWQARATNAANGVEDDGNFDFETTNIPSWELRIEGRLLPKTSVGIATATVGADGDVEMGGTEAPAKQEKLFTEFLRSVVVEEVREQPNGYSEGPILEWHRPQPPRPVAGQPPQQQPASVEVPSAPGIAVKRKGDTDVPVTITITLEQSPERYRLSPKLAQILDTPEDTRAQVIMNLWHYVRANKLLDSDEKRLVINDAPLREIFGQDRTFFPTVPELITRHLSPVEPITLKYTIKTSADRTVAPEYYDVEVDVDDGSRLAVRQTLQKLAQASGNTAGGASARASEIDRELADLMPILDTALTKRHFLHSLATDPVTFLNDWYSAQAADLELILADTKYANQEQLRRADFYQDKSNKAWLNEGVFHYLAAQRQ
ncbi:SWI/SNF and RSC complex subunit Ssr3 [Savitreella phatthalungensis]